VGKKFASAFASTKTVEFGPVAMNGALPAAPGMYVACRREPSGAKTASVPVKADPQVAILFMTGFTPAENPETYALPAASSANPGTELAYAPGMVWERVSAPVESKRSNAAWLVPLLPYTTGFPAASTATDTEENESVAE